MAEITDYMKNKIDPTCILHGKKASEHEGGFCLFCCLCFKALTPSECHVKADGKLEDVCKPCAEKENSETMRRINIMAEEKTYRIGITCTNCGETLSEPGMAAENMGHMVLVWIHIPKGTSVEAFLAKKKCNNCGCKGHLVKHERED